MKHYPLPLLICLFLTALCADAQGGIVDFDSDRWELVDAEIVEHLGRKALLGTAILKDVQFENGVIEVDIAGNGFIRSYPGVVFRRQSEVDFERFYIRPHRGNGLFDDALQYVPTINGVAGWQLYSGDGFTAAGVIPNEEWVHIKIEVKGTQGRVYLGDAEEPALVIHELKHGVSSGTIGVMGMKNQQAYFSNFRYESTDELQFDPPPEEVQPLGMITEWELSRPFKHSKIDIERTPAAQGFAELQWREVTAEHSGLVDVSRHIRRTPGEPDWVWARKVIKTESARTMELSFGYSDYISVFLNGRLLLTANSAYRSRDPGFVGIIGLNDSVYLPLQEGENELLFLVGESFGGWGFMARDAEAIFMHESLTKLWEIDRTFKFPESVQYDAERDLLYVSNFFNGGKEFVSRVKPDGEILDLEWVAGLDRPTGMYLDRERLYVVERGGLVEIDVASGEITARHPIPDAGFPNDVTGDPSTGVLYVSDSQRNVVYRFRAGEFEVWLEGEDFKGLNGLFIDDGRLLVGCSGDGCIRSVGLADGKSETLVCLGGGSVMDGVRGDGRGNFIVSDFRGRAFLVTPSGEKTELLNTTARGIFCADLEYVPEKNLIVIPTLNNNLLAAYEYKRE
jgi:sugar lactone lactonase YvrE